jgi:hypothetical protein
MPSIFDPLNSLHTIYKDFANQKDGHMSKEVYYGYKLKNQTVAIAAVSSLALGVSYQQGWLSNDTMKTMFNEGNQAVNGFINSVFSSNVDFNAVTVGSWVAAVGICAAIGTNLYRAERLQNIKYFQEKLLNEFNIDIDLQGFNGLKVSEIHKQGLMANSILGNHFKLGEAQFLSFINKTLQKGRASKSYLMKYLPKKFTNFLNKQNYNLIKLNELSEPDNGQKEVLESWKKSVNYFLYRTYRDYYNHKEETQNVALNKHIKEIISGSDNASYNPEEIKIKELREINEKSIINAYETLLTQSIQLNFCKGLKMYCEQYLKEANPKTGKLINPSNELKKIVNKLKKFGQLPEMTNKYKTIDGQKETTYSIKEYKIMEKLFPKKGKPTLNENNFLLIKQIASENYAKTLQRLNPNLSNGGTLNLILFEDAFVYQRNHIITRGNKNGLNYRDFRKDYDEKDDTAMEMTPENRIKVTGFKVDTIDKYKTNDQRKQYKSNVVLKKVEKSSALHHYNKNHRPKF